MGRRKDQITENKIARLAANRAAGCLCDAGESTACSRPARFEEIHRFWPTAADKVAGAAPTVTVLQVCMNHFAMVGYEGANFTVLAHRPLAPRPAFEVVGVISDTDKL